MVLMREHASRNLPWHLVLRMQLRINLLKCCGYGSGPFLPQESKIRIRDDFFQISDPYHIPNKIYLQDFTFKNGRKQEKLNFV
jgi:hypothetical protein